MKKGGTCGYNSALHRVLRPAALSREPMEGEIHTILDGALHRVLRPAALSREPTEGEIRTILDGAIASGAML